MMEGAFPTDGMSVPGDTVDQAGIDAMFGFDTPQPRGVTTGLKALLEADVVNRERLPMLEVIGERMARTFATSMRNLTSDSLDVHLIQVITTRFGDFMNRLTLPTMIGVFQVKEWENYGAVTVDSGLIYAVVDSLLGGRRGGAPIRIEGRGYTAIETMLVGKMMQQALDDFEQAFEAIEPIDATLERVETTPRFAAIAGPSNLAAVASFRVDMEGRGGTFDIVLPYATIETVRDKLVQRFAGEKLGRDGLWERHMTSELLVAQVEIEAVLGERSIRMNDYLPFQVGQTISLARDPDEPVELACNGIKLGRAEVGGRAGLIAVQLLNDIMTGDTK